MSLGASEVISYVLIFIITISLASAAYLYVIPKLSNMRVGSEFSYMTNQMKTLDDKIEYVSRGGQGAKDSVGIAIQQGILQVFSNDTIIYSVPSGACLQAQNVSGLYFMFQTTAVACINKIILNYTTIDINNNASFSGQFNVWVENIGYNATSAKPLLNFTVG